MKMTLSDANAIQAPTTGMPLITMNSAIRLDSWKDIASHFRRSVRTVQRWERVEGMPVHRHAHEKGDSLFAYTNELDQWRKSRSHAGPKVDVASAQRPIHNLPLKELAGLRRLLEAVLEQLARHLHRQASSQTPRPLLVLLIAADVSAITPKDGLTNRTPSLVSIRTIRPLLF